MKLISLNIEANRHLNLVIPFLKNEEADVICLQEIFKVNVEQFEKELGKKGYFFPMLNRIDRPEPWEADPLGIQGIAIFTSLNLTSIKNHYYIGTGSIPIFTGPLSYDRCVAIVEVRKGDEVFTIATTHFSWAANGGTNDQQKVGFTKLIEILKDYQEIILCGDFNAPRGKEIFTGFSQNFTDNVPIEVKTTIDPQLHRAGALQYVVDGIFSRGYEVTDFKLVNGVSDHMALICTVKK